MVTTNKGRYLLELTTPGDLEIAISRAFDAPSPLVFEAYTRPEHIERWMLGPEGWSMPVCEVDLRPGGRYRFVWRRATGTEMEIRGVYREVVPPTRLVTVDSWGGNWPETLNTITFTEVDGRTTLINTMRFPSKQARDAALETGMEDGSAKSFDRLEDYLAEAHQRPSPGR